eukprot:jgi/Psemu1/288372/fgenesh1_pg.257_\
MCMFSSASANRADSNPYQHRDGVSYEYPRQKKNPSQTSPREIVSRKTDADSNTARNGNNARAQRLSTRKTYVMEEDSDSDSDYDDDSSDDEEYVLESSRTTKSPDDGKNATKCENRYNLRNELPRGERSATLRRSSASPLANKAKNQESVDRSAHEIGNKKRKPARDNGRLPDGECRPFGDNPQVSFGHSQNDNPSDAQDDELLKPPDERLEDENALRKRLLCSYKDLEKICQELETTNAELQRNILEAVLKGLRKKYHARQLNNQLVWLEQGLASRRGTKEDLSPLVSPGKKSFNEKLRKELENTRSKLGLMVQNHNLLLEELAKAHMLNRSLNSNHGSDRAQFRYQNLKDSDAF